MLAVGRALEGRSMGSVLTTAGLVMATLLLVFAAAWALWFATRALIVREMRPAARRAAVLAARDLDRDDLAAVRVPGDMDAEPFLRVRASLLEHRAADPGVRFLYTLRKLPAEHAWEWVVDTDPFDQDEDGDGVIAPEEEGAPPGHPLDDRSFPGLRRVLASGQADAEDDVYTDKWGIFLTGYAPIPARDGGTYVLAADLTNEPLVRLRDRLFLVFVALGLLLGLGVVLARRRGQALPPGFVRSA
jgi:hypothetical protein